VNRKKRMRKARDIAWQRIGRLFEMAEEEHESHLERCDRYVYLARRIGMRLRVRIPRRLKRKMCKHCHCYLSPDRSRVRLRNGVLTVTCLKCGGQMRYPYRNSRLPSHST